MQDKARDLGLEMEMVMVMAVGTTLSWARARDTYVELVNELELHDR
jgi:hypothetical protein